MDKFACTPLNFHDFSLISNIYINIHEYSKGEFQICPRMDFDNILYVEYLRYSNYKNEIISFLEGC